MRRPTRHMRGRKASILLMSLGLLLVSAASLAAHDLFLRLQSFFVPSDAEVRVYVLNGTFSESEANVARDRLRDLSVVAPSGITHPDLAAWREQGDTTVLSFRTGESGTYIVGASIHPRELDLGAADFNRYLETDGVPDILQERRLRGQLDEPVRERYSKHVKALIQVGPTRTDEYRTPLGYPAELIPLENPYSIGAGDTLRVRAVVDGRPVGNQFVVAGGRTPRGERLPQYTTRTDSEGVARVPLGARGHWYVKFIHMVPAGRNSGVDYESKWANITFEVP